MKSFTKVKPLFCALALIASCAPRSSHAAWATPAATPDDAARVTTADTAFGFDLLGNMAHSGGNVFVSPFSVAQALSLALNGAGGDTRRQIARTLHLKGMRLLAVNAANNALLAQLRGPEPDVTLSIANALWVNRGLKFNPGFESRCQQFYGATAATLDFSSPASAARINRWVSDQTQGKIARIVSPEILNNGTAVLTNAVYFHGRWSQIFNRAETRDAPFAVSVDQTKPVPMMAQISSYSYLKTDDFQVIRLPYGKGRAAMYVLLPNRADELDDLIASATPQRWSEWIGAMKPTRLQIRLPRFTASQAITLNAPLSALGMADAFQGGADFGPMGMPGSYIGAVLHKATLDVNEQGSTAAAATAIVLTRGRIMPPPVRMIVDHPFLCAIRDDTTGALLFVGAIRDPQ